MQISSFSTSDAFNQSDSNNSFPINKYGSVVWWLKALIGSLSHYNNLRR